jgi:ATP-dependent DNA ligase
VVKSDKPIAVVPAEAFPRLCTRSFQLPVRSCVVDGEAIASDLNGLAVFNLLRYRRRDEAVLLCASHLMELDGNDLRRSPSRNARLCWQAEERGGRAVSHRIRHCQYRRRALRNFGREEATAELPRKAFNEP